jgi:hypothetical protein
MKFDIRISPRFRQQHLETMSFRGFNEFVIANCRHSLLKAL